MAKMIPIAIGILIGLGVIAASRKKVWAAGPQGLTRVFDPIYQGECPGIPVEYLASLAKYESDANPAAANPGEGVGLLQVVSVVRVEYNDRNGTNYSRADLLDPVINARIACSVLARIANYYSAAFARAFPHTSWSDQRFVEVVTMGWNVGWSETNGVGRVIKVLLGEGHTTDITVDLIKQRAASLPEVTEKIWRSSAAGWAKRVTATYFWLRGQV